MSHSNVTYQVIPAKREGETLVAKYIDSSSKKKSIFLHSRINPIQEARSFAQKSIQAESSKLSAVFVFGLGLGYHVKEIRGLLPDNCLLVVFEKEKRIAMMSPLENSKNLYIKINPGEKETEELIQKVPSAHVKFIIHRPSYDLFPDYYENLRKKVESLLSHKDINIATLSRFERIWLKNFLVNLPLIFKSKTLAKIQNQKISAKGLTSALVGGGPSLTAAIQALREHRENIFIACVDTALKPLINAGIKPDLVFTVDAQFLNSKYLFQAPENIPLVAEPTCHPLSIRHWPGDIYFFSSPFQYVKWTEESLGFFGELKHGGSVSTNAFDFLARSGFDRIFLIGQDLSFTKSRAHAEGTILDENLYIKENRLNGRENALINQLKSLPPLHFKNIRGQDIITNQKLHFFKTWFDKEIPLSKCEVINSSEEGIILEGASYGKLDSKGALKSAHPFTIQFQKPNRQDVKGESGASAYKKMEFQKKYKDVLKTIPELLDILKNGEKTARELKKIIQEQILKIKKRDREISQAIARLQEIDSMLKKFQETNALLSPVMQKIIQPILEGSSDILEEEEKKDPLLENASISIKLYQGIHDAMVFSYNTMLKGLLVMEQA